MNSDAYHRQVLAYLEDHGMNPDLMADERHLVATGFADDIPPVDLAAAIMARRERNSCA